jgi:hypothetical protein
MNGAINSFDSKKSFDTRNKSTQQRFCKVALMTSSFLAKQHAPAAVSHHAGARHIIAKFKDSARSFVPFSAGIPVLIKAWIGIHFSKATKSSFCTIVTSI